ncbi:MAG: HD domain-containing protein [Candidatus Atribacteria bacterium]|nr:HD domain-containing protein [Candidatus Atribacteria bacterium]
MTKQLKLYVLIISFLAIALFIYLIPTIPHFTDIWVSLLFFIVVLILAEFFPVSLPAGGEITISFPIDFVIILIYGPGMAMIVSAVSSFGMLFGKTNRNIERVLFNASQFSLASGLAGVIYQGAGGVIGTQNLLKFIMPAALCALTYCVVNSFLVAGVISLDSGMSISKVYRMNIREVIPSYLAEAPLGFIMAIIYIEVGILGILLFFFPLLLARQSFELYTKMRKMYIDTIKTLAATIDAKDPYTHGHSERVSQMAVKLAKKLGYAENEIEYIEYAAILHDIGKIGIGDHILGKTDRLTDEEYEIIKKHPVIGANIIESIEFLKKCSKTVLHHHEHFDGRGYPDGLKGEDIPKTARLLTIVDSYDAMNSDRPYRTRLSKEAILNELENEAGKQFDPEMVKMFISMLKEKEI